MLASRFCRAVLTKTVPLKFYSNIVDVKKFCVGIVGAGPAGFYTAQSLFKDFADIKKKHQSFDNIHFQVDILERTPIGNGLVRSGVAPDHPEVKHVQNRFQEFLSEYHQNPSMKLNFFGNIEVGRTKSQSVIKSNELIQIPLPDIQNCYHALVFVSLT